MPCRVSALPTSLRRSVPSWRHREFAVWSSPAICLSLARLALWRANCSIGVRPRVSSWPAWCPAITIAAWLRRPELPICPEGFVLGRWHIVHGDEQLPDGPVVQGHEHPIARWEERVGGPCFLVAKRRLILPAFSPDAAGVNVLFMARCAHSTVVLSPGSGYSISERWERCAARGLALQFSPSPRYSGERGRG